MRVILTFCFRTNFLAHGPLHEDPDVDKTRVSLDFILILPRSIRKEREHTQVKGERRDMTPYQSIQGVVCAKRDTHVWGFISWPVSLSQENQSLLRGRSTELPKMNAT